MDISVIGTGYVGLVTGACLADHGNRVVCVDNDPKKIDMLTNGEIPFFEPGLAALVKRNVKEERLRFTDDLKSAVSDCRLHFICVGTPYRESIGTLDTSNLEKVAVGIAQHARDGDALIIKSTVPVGTADRVRSAVDRPSLIIANNPEFLKEGTAVDDFMKPDRIILGLSDQEAPIRSNLEELYRPFVRTGNPILVMDNRSAEMVKLASNGYLATRISFMNEISNLCEHLGADVSAVRNGMGLDVRIGHRYLFPGLGYGGSCFPKDIQALRQLACDYDFGARILTATHEVNQQQRVNFLRKVWHYLGDRSPSQSTVAVWGLAFKANTDDIREAPSIDIIEALLKKGVTVRVYDPEAAENTREHFSDRLTYCDTMYDCLENADVLCVCTEWGVFRNPDFERMKSMMRKPVIIDGRNLYTKEQLGQRGFTYSFIGEPDSVLSQRSSD